MTPLQNFQAVFKDRRAGEDLLVMPLIMTLAARFIDVPYSQYLRDPMVQARAQYAVSEEFGIDVLSVCSDPTTELSSMGGSVTWFDNDPPMPDHDRPLLADPTDLKHLVLPNPKGKNRMADRIAAVREMKRLSNNRAPVLGWVEGPISQGAVMRGMTTLMEDLLDDPEFVEELFLFNVKLAVGYAKAQVEAGADMIGFGDAPASLIGPEMYKNFVLPHERRMVAAIKSLGVPVRMHICGNTSKLVNLMAKSGVDMVDIDSLTDFKSAADAFPPDVMLLGNLDPVREVLRSNPEAIRNRLAECHRIAGPNYIVGAGCEIPAKTPDENLRAFSAYGHKVR